MFLLFLFEGLTDSTYPIIIFLFFHCIWPVLSCFWYNMVIFTGNFSGDFCFTAAFLIAMMNDLLCSCFFI